MVHVPTFIIQHSTLIQTPYRGVLNTTLFNPEVHFHIESFKFQRIYKYLKEK